MISTLISKNRNFSVVENIKINSENKLYFETILITLNDELVLKYLKGEINYISIQLNLSTNKKTLH